MIEHMDVNLGGNVLPFKPKRAQVLLPDPHNPDGSLSYETGVLDISFDELLSVLRDNGIGVTQYLITDSGEKLTIAND